MQKTSLLVLAVICLVITGCAPKTGNISIQNMDDISTPTKVASPMPDLQTTEPSTSPSVVTSLTSEKPVPSQTEKEDDNIAGLTIMLNIQPITFTLGMTMDEAEQKLDKAKVRYIYQEDLSTKRGWSGYTIHIIDHGLLTFDIMKKQLHEIMIEYTKTTETNIGLSFDSGKCGMEEALGTSYTSHEETIYEYNKGSYYVEVVVVLDRVTSYGVSEYSSEQYHSLVDVGNIEICNDFGECGTLHIGMERRETLDLLEQLGIKTQVQEYHINANNPILSNCQRIDAQGTALHLNGYGSCFKIDVHDQKTPHGLEIGDSVDRIEKLYGKPYQKYWLTNGNQRFEYIDGINYFFVDVEFVAMDDGVIMQAKSWGYSRYQSDMWGQEVTKPIYTSDSVKMIEQPYYAPYFFDLDNDGDIEQITMTVQEGLCDLLMEVTNGEEVKTWEVGSNTPRVFYFINQKGKLAVMLSYDVASDDYITQIYTFEGTSPVTKGVLPGLVTGVDTDSVAFFDCVFVLGTWRANIQYTMGEEFILTPFGDSLWHIDPEEFEERMLTVTKEVPIQMLLDGRYINDTLSVGTKLWPTATDRTSFVMFETEDGRQGKINFERREGFLYIDGIADEELFDGIEYCG